ncbi:methyl-accepting chemotaxis protein [Defluviitalea saccharophila]|uniref:Methyl-accepting chemotaxis protein n=1 Tax=Defluviitalea saccharophila TaxID=879970 RepID=A0ABZ2Y6T4_9FIRM|nr:methyl-accepting chemotaxis protein [Candidatus Epulonipiscium sp.]
MELFVKSFSKSILNKILVVVIVMQVSSLIIVVINNSLETTRRIKRFANESEILLAKQIEKSSEKLFASIELTLQAISRENSVSNILISEDNKKKILGDFKYYEEGNGAIKRLMIATYNNIFYQYPETKTVSLNYEPTKEVWYKKAMSNKGRVVYLSPAANEQSGNTEIIIAKTVNKDAKTIGVVAAAVSTDYFSSILEEIYLGKTGYAYAVNSDGIITAHRKKEMISKSISSEPFFEKIKDLDTGQLEYEINGKEYFMNFTTNARTGWKFIVVMESKEIEDDIKNMILKNVMILLVVLILGICFSIWIVSGITKPMKYLLDGMKKVEQGDLEVHLIEQSRDEVGKLTRKFNEMIEQIRNLVKSILETAHLLFYSSKEFHRICESHSVSAQVISASLEQLSSTSDLQFTETDHMLKQTMQFSDYINVIIQNAREVMEQAEESKRVNRLGVERVKELHKISKTGMDLGKEVTIEIEGLQSKTKAVANIIYNIEDIARQTNLISLNASIEAARAGEYGRSFGVVATEIRLLAEQTEKLTHTMYSYLGEMVSQVEKATRIMEEVRQISTLQYEAMLNTENVFTHIDKIAGEIALKITRLNEAIYYMNLEKNNLLEGIEHIAHQVEDSALMCRHIHESVEEQTSNIEKIFRSSEELLKMAQNLENKTSMFQLKS